ncbi:MAG: YtxH domain-containing protein [Hyphomicrobiales bacterium]
MKKVKTTSRSLILLTTGVTVGALAGMALGVLFAPAKGNKTRKKIKKKASEISDKIDHLKENISEYIDHKKCKPVEDINDPMDSN